MIKGSIIAVQIIAGSTAFVASSVITWHVIGEVKSLVAEWSTFHAIKPILEGVERTKNTPVEKLPLPKSMVFDYRG